LSEGIAAQRKAERIGKSHGLGIQALKLGSNAKPNLPQFTRNQVNPPPKNADFKGIKSLEIPRFSQVIHIPLSKHFYEIQGG
jgi:hypothetical protein